MFRPSYRRKEGDGIFYFDRNETKAHITIGILGCHPGAGVTQLAISLGTYCASRRRLRTACLELHKRSELARLIPESALADSIHRHALQCSKAPDAADTSKAEGVKNISAALLGGADIGSNLIICGERPRCCRHIPPQPGRRRRCRCGRCCGDSCGSRSPGFRRSLPCGARRHNRPGSPPAGGTRPG